MDQNQNQHQQPTSDADIQELQARIEATRATLSSLQPDNPKYLQTKKALLDLEVKLHHIQTQSGRNPSSARRDHGVFTFTPLGSTTSGTRSAQPYKTNSASRMNVEREQGNSEFVRNIPTGSIDCVLMTDTAEQETRTKAAAPPNSKSQSSKSAKLQERLQRIQIALDKEEESCSQ